MVYLEVYAVDFESQRQGVASGLIKALLELYAEADVIKALVREHNTGSLATLTVVGEGKGRVVEVVGPLPDSSVTSEGKLRPVLLWKPAICNRQRNAWRFPRRVSGEKKK